MGEYFRCYCLICGCPFAKDDGHDDMAVPEERHWLTQAVLLTVLSPTDGDQTVLEMRARWAPGHGREVRNFEVLETGERLLAKEWEHPGGMAMVLAVHTSCLTICKRAMNFIHGFNVASRRQAPSMFELHQILTSRVMQSDILGHLIDEPSDYYGARRFQAQQWELYTNLGHDENTVESCSSDNDPDLEDLIYYHLEHDPIRVPSLTTYVLDQLQAIPDSAAMGSRHRYLPAEIVTEIVCVLRRFDDIPAARDRLLSQEFWQQALSDGLYPWLWDFSASDVAAKQTMCPVGMVWDWEKLARQLGQKELYLPMSPGWISLGLKNRRRIWQLVLDVFGNQHQS